MIDIEVDFFDEIARKVLAEYPECYITSKAEVAPPRFPAATVIQVSSSEAQWRADSSGEENANNLTYEVNVYSNSEKDKHDECKGILQIIDTAMRDRNMTRQFSEPFDNAADPSIYRLHARYYGLVDKNLVHYRR